MEAEEPPRPRRAPLQPVLQLRARRGLDKVGGGVGMGGSQKWGWSQLWGEGRNGEGGGGASIEGGSQLWEGEINMGGSQLWGGID